MSEINYSLIIDKSLHYVVRNVLQIVSNNGLDAIGQNILVHGHHFFISFLTNYPGVILSDYIKVKYPNEITIVLQHQFEGLTVKDNLFSVILSFGGIKELIVVPYEALTAFADPSVKFGLQFKHAHLFYNDSLNNESIVEKTSVASLNKDNNDANISNLDNTTDSSAEKSEKSNVIDFKSFLSKKKKNN